jgi:hypothetical protein
MSRRLTFGNRRFALLAAATGVALAAVLAFSLANAGAGRAASVSCPTFTVLHDDRIGPMRLPQGPYNVRVTGISCATSTQLFIQFLNDWDGKLPGGWRPIAQGNGKGTFRGPGGKSFAVAHTGGSTNNTGSLVCSQRLVLTANDRIGSLVLNKGRYIVDRLGPLSPSCAQALGLLQTFLTDFDGVLPGGWLVLPNDGSFVKGSVSYGFRLEPDPDSGGGTRFPSVTTRCPATFRVLHNDKIGALSFPVGNYWVSIYKDSNITCPQSTTLFAAFLNRPDGSLPSPWVINVASGSFRQGKTSSYGFVAKPAFNDSLTVPKG